MKILLTGGSGMVGSNILEHSKSSDYTFLSPSRERLDLLNFNETFNYVHKHKPDFVVHSAGIVGGIQANIANPVKFLVQNTDIGRNIIIASKENGVRRLLNLSSSCMYPRNAANPLDENQILNGALEPTNEGYALAKIFATRLCEYISKENASFGYKTVIPCNLYGRYDKFSEQHSHMIPAVIKKIHEAKKKNSPSVTIWGDGTVRREFMYAGDLAAFIFYAIENFERMPQNLNVGIGKDFSINEYYNVIADTLKFSGTFNHDLSKPIGMKQKLVNGEKLKDFGWQHTTTLAEGIKKTYQYYLSTLEND